jgi:hypothetical protein
LEGDSEFVDRLKLAPNSRILQQSAEAEKKGLILAAHVRGVEPAALDDKGSEAWSHAGQPAANL